MQFQSEGGWLETQEELMFQFASEDMGEKKTMSQFKGSQQEKYWGGGSAFLF